MDIEQIFINWDGLDTEQIDMIAYHAGEIAQRLELLRGPHINFSPDWHEGHILKHARAIQHVLGFIPALMVGLIEAEACQMLEARGAFVGFDDEARA